MTQRFGERGSADARTDYHQSAEDKQIECEFLTDLLDELIAAPTNAGSDVSSNLTVDRDGMLINRSLRYLESDRPTGWAWPLVEQTLDIHYAQAKTGLQSEIYHVRLGTIIHQQGITQDPIRNSFEIGYFGSGRRSLIASVEEPNFVDENESDYTSRQTTPYDHAYLYGQLASFLALIDAQTLEESRTA